MIIVSIGVWNFHARRAASGWAGGRGGGISYPGEREDNSAAVLSAIKRISASQFLVLLLLQTTQLVFVVPNGQFLPYVPCCLNS